MKKAFKLLNDWNLLKFINIRIKNKDFHKNYSFPIIHGFGTEYLYEDKEPWMDQVVLKMDLPDGELFIDVGFNVGQTLIKLRKSYNHIPYVGFDPNPGCVSYITELISVNNIDKVKVLNLALSDRKRIHHLHLYENDRDSKASIIENFRENRVYKRIPVISEKGDEIIGTVSEGTKLSCIKIDVEGSELEVLNGLKNSIIRDQPVILCEILPVYNANNKKRLKRQKGIAEFLKSIDYCIYRIIKNHNNQFQSLYPLEEFDIHSNLALCDYIFASKTKALNFG